MINLLYQTQDKDKGYLPNSIPHWKRNDEYYKNYGNVKFQYLEELLDYSNISYNKCNLDHAIKSTETFWYHIQPEWIDLSFFYENVFHYIDEDYLRAIRIEENVKILLWFPSEGFHLDMPRFIDDILYTLGDKGIPEEKVYLVFGDLRIEENFKHYCNKKKIDCKIKTFGLNIFELNYWLETDRMYFNKKRMREIKVSDELVDEKLIDKDQHRPLKFVCRNANPRPHRIYLTSQLYKEGLDSKGYISFLNRYFTPGVPTNTETFTERLDKQNIIQEMEEFLEKTPIILDHDGSSINDSLNQRRMKAEHYYNTYFSIVNETVSNSEPGDPLFITEKVYQPILQLHPFVVLGSRGTLDYLQDCGYRTFNNWALLNESYDREPNSAKRTDMVLDNIKRLCWWPTEGLHKEYYRIFDTLLYNREHFLKLNRSEYLNKLLLWLKK